MSARIRIDPTLCRGHAICALFFSDGVELDRWGFGRVIDDGADSERRLRKARRAAAACPNGAFVITETGTPQDIGVDTSTLPCD